VRAAYRYATVVVFLGVLAQIGAAGYGAFYTANKLQDKGDTLSHEGFDHGWDFHSGFGYVVVIATIVLLLIAFAARLGKPRIYVPAALAIAGIVQVLLAWLGESVPGLGFLHPLDALIIFSLSGAAAHVAWRDQRRARRTSA
jgi:hypothetical protein